MRCLDESVAGELACPHAPSELLPWILREIPYTSLDVLVLASIAFIVIVIGLAIVRAAQGHR